MLSNAPSAIQVLVSTQSLTARKELVKIAKDYAENARIAARHVRRDAMEQLKKLEKDSDISQDDGRVQSEKVQKHTDETIAEVDKLLHVKEAEIMHV